MWNCLEDFVEWYRASDLPIRPPFEASVLATDASYSYVLYREGRFQVTLYLVVGGLAQVLEPLRNRGFVCVCLPLLRPASGAAAHTDAAFLLAEEWPKPGTSPASPLRDAPAGPSRLSAAWDTVEDFARWYIDAAYPFRVPEQDPLYRTDNSRSLVLYRSGQFQAELYLVRPNTSSPEHRHPGVESIIVPWGGDFRSTLDGELEDTRGAWHRPSPEGTIRLFGAAGARLDDSHTHALHALDKGAAFLSIEKWRKDLAPNSVTISWDGEPVDEEHGALIRRAPARSESSF